MQWPGFMNLQKYEEKQQNVFEGIAFSDEVWYTEFANFG